MYAEHAYLSMNLIFLLSFALVLVIPSLTAATLGSRSPFGKNAPATEARPTFDPRTLIPNTLAPRHSRTVTWWAPGSQTHIIITEAQRIAGEAAMDVLNDVYTYLVDRIEMLGDGVSSGGSWAYNQVGLALRARNANNHQTTWGVLGAAIDALMDYMGRTGFHGGMHLCNP